MLFFLTAGSRTKLYRLRTCSEGPYVGVWRCPTSLLGIGANEVHMGKAEKLFTDGEAYERLMGRWSRLVGETFLDWLDVPNGLRWLDVGCGNGAFTEELIARCAPDTVTAIDPSDDQLAYARTQLGAKTANFRVGDAQKLPFGDGSFDVAIMALVISFLPDPDKAAAEMARVVRPGGWVADVYVGHSRRWSANRPYLRNIGSNGHDFSASGQPRGFTAGSHAGLVGGPGSIIDTRVIRIPVVYSDFDDFWDSNTVLIGPQGKLIAGMSTSEREQLRTDLRDRLSTASDGRIVYEVIRERRERPSTQIRPLTGASGMCARLWHGQSDRRFRPVGSCLPSHPKSGGLSIPEQHSSLLRLLV